MSQALTLTSLSTADDLIEWALARFERPLLSTKFGPESAVLLHMVTQRRPGIPVVWVDSGYNTRLTQRFARQLSERLNLDLRTYQPRSMDWEAVPDLDDPAHAEFTQRVKLEPFQRALRELRPDCWLTALRREQTAHRAGQAAVQQSAHGYTKLAPLLDWTTEDMAAYLRQHHLPRGPECYDPTKGAARRECGLHLVY